MKNFIKQTVAKCRERGFVETISKRRRYLPLINHSNLGARNHAERQAVNTTIQGSAADLVKTAMVQLQQQLSSSFPATIISHRHRDKGKIGKYCLYFIINIIIVLIQNKKENWYNKSIVILGKMFDETVCKYLL